MKRSQFFPLNQSLLMPKKNRKMFFSRSTNQGPRSNNKISGIRKISRVVLTMRQRTASRRVIQVF